MSSEAVERAMERVDGDWGAATELERRLAAEVLRLRSELAKALAVVEAARKYWDGCSKYDHICGLCDSHNELGDTLYAFDAGRKP